MKKYGSVILGTDKFQGASCKNMIKAALTAGYRIVDTAQAYGNEEVIGQAIQETTTVHRDDLFLITKISSGWKKNPKCCRGLRIGAKVAGQAWSAVYGSILDSFAGRGRRRTSSDMAGTRAAPHRRPHQVYRRQQLRYYAPRRNGYVFDNRPPSCEPDRGEQVSLTPTPAHLLQLQTTEYAAHKASPMAPTERARRTLSQAKNRRPGVLLHRAQPEGR
jgi:hypothetical protein